MTNADWLSILDKSVPVVAAILGTLLGLYAPIIHNRLQKAKRKQEVKSQLGSLISQLFSSLKMLMTEINYMRLHVTMLEHKRKMWQDELDMTLKEKQKEMMESIKQDCNLHQKRVEKYSDSIDSTESQIIALVWELDSLFGAEIFKSVESLIRNTTKEVTSRDYLVLHEYETLDYANIMDVQDRIRKEIDSKIKAISIKSAATMNEFLNCFK